MGRMVLAVETSFDDAAIAVIGGDGVVLASVQRLGSSQYKSWGGVVPEIAARSHLTDLPVLFVALRERVQVSGLDAIAVTRGPGLMGSLLVGLSFAQGLAVAA